MRCIWLVLLFSSLVASEEAQVRKIRLDNGLAAYLVSDPELSQETVAIGVEVGSWNDPKEHPGMAHFVEHLLFMGSEKHPDESDFLQFVSDRGGMTNAMTMHDRTVYGFSIYEEWFDEALDRFSHFFLDPLFTQSAIDREIHAVDHEFGDQYEDNGIRTWRILKQTGNSDHPNALFSIGNLNSLRSATTQSMKKWFEKYYGAKNMRLVILSSLPLEDLVEKATTYFSQIPPGSKEELQLSEVISSEQQGKMIYVSPVKEEKVLDLVWELPEKFAKDNERYPANLISEALNYSGEGSLFALLRKEGLAKSFRAQPLRLSKSNLLLDMEISLTDKGVKNLDPVISQVFGAIASLKEQGIPEHLFEGLKTSTSFSSFFENSPFMLALEYAQGMMNEELETFPERFTSPQIYDPAFTEEFLSHLAPEKCVFFLLAPPKITGIQPTLLEKWMKGEFTIRSVAAESLATWKKVEPHSQIAFPLPQEKKPEESPESITLQNDDSALIEFVYKNKGVELDLLLETPLLDGSVESKVLAEIFIKGAYKTFRELIEQGTHFDFSVAQTGKELNLCITSEDKSLSLLCETLKNFRKAYLAEEDFNRFQSDLAKRWSQDKKPLEQAHDILERTFFKDRYTSKELLEALQTISYAQFSQFANSFLKSAYITGNITGDLEEVAAAKFWRQIRKILDITPLKSRDIHLELERPLLPLHFTETSSRVGSACILVVEEGEESEQSLAAHKMLEKILSNDFFDDLRTKQQTAYVVELQGLILEKVLYQCFAAQSTTYEAKELFLRFSDFLDRFASDFRQRVDEERFFQVKKALLKGSQSSNPIFDPEEEEEIKTEALEALTYEELCFYVETHLFQNPHKLSILIQGNKILPIRELIPN